MTLKIKNLQRRILHAVQLITGAGHHKIKLVQPSDFVTPPTDSNGTPLGQQFRMMILALCQRSNPVGKRQRLRKITEAITSDVANAKDLVSDLSDSDLAAYKEILDIQEKINDLSAQYTENETKLSDGIIESRGEREKLLEQQKEENLLATML